MFYFLAIDPTQIIYDAPAKVMYNADNLIYDFILLFYKSSIYIFMN